jgi:hypothetical protein
MINILLLTVMPLQMPMRVLSLTSIFLVLSTLLSCGENNQISGGGTHGGNPTEFSGLILDENGKAQENVEVSLIPEGQVPFSKNAQFYTVHTNAKGEFRIAIDGIDKYSSLNLSAVNTNTQAALFKRGINDGSSDPQFSLGEITLTQMGALKISLPQFETGGGCESYVYIEGSPFYKKLENNESELVFSDLAAGEYNFQLGKCVDVAAFSIQIAKGMVQSNDTLNISIQTTVGTKYYVSAGGFDSNSGTESYPWATIQYAADQSGAGDTIVVGSGSFNEIVQVVNSGDLFSPIVIQSIDSAKVSGFNINADHIIIEGFQIEYLGGDSSDIGVFANGKDIVIQQNTFTNLPLWSIRAGKLNQHTQSMRVIGNKVQNGGAGFLLFGDYILVDNNEFEQLQYKTGKPDAIVFFGSNIRMQNNLIWGSTPDDVAGSETGITAFQTWDNNGEYARNIVIEGNRVYGVSSCFVLEGLFNRQNRDFLVKNNVCSDIWLYTGIVHDIHNARFFHNTFHHSVNQGIAFRGMGINIEVINNIFSANEYAFTVENDEFFTADYNLYHETSSTQWDASHSFAGDPKFTDVQTDDFSLLSGSEAIDRGLYVEVNTDLNGDSRLSGKQVDIGAYEYNP